MEVLSKMINREIEDVHLMGFTVEGSHGDILTISHLVYLFIFLCLFSMI